MPVVDVHTHMLTQNYLDLLVEYGAPQYQRTVNQAGEDVILAGSVPFFTLNSAMWDYERRIEDMDAAGVDIAVVSLTCPNVYFGDADTSLAAARSINDSMAAAQTAWPGRIRWFASLPWQYPERAVAELDRARNAGAAGVIVIATIGEKQLTDPGFEPVWAEIDRLALPVLVHPGPPIGAQALGLADYGLVPSAGFPFDTTLAFARMFFDGFLDRFTRLKLIAAHGGGALPYLAARLDRCHAEIAACSAKTATRPSEYMQRIYYDAVVYSPAALSLCIEAAGSADRVLFGSDYPHNIGDMAGCLERTNRLPQDWAERVRGQNAVDLFGL